jgi:hypothetical protein
MDGACLIEDNNFPDGSFTDENFTDENFFWGHQGAMQAPFFLSCPSTFAGTVRLA